MIWPNHLSVILPAAFSTIHALHLPTPSNQTVGFPSKLAFVWECRFGPHYIPPRYVDCRVACGQLPNSEAQATFHDTGEDDGYKLPVIRSYKTCALSVSLLQDGAQQDESSWSDITFRAEILNDLCVNGRNRGGYIHVGQNERIRIELGSVRSRNGTVVGGQLDIT